VYAEKSHKDPRSTNRCGKTSLIELIQYGLGRRSDDRKKFYFAPILNKLQTLWLEVEINGASLTIERSLSELSAKLGVREGPYVPGIEKSPSEMVSVEDMSDLMLASLGIPKVAVKTAKGDPSPLTFPSLMRAFILHQEDSFGAILDKIIPDRRRSDILGFLTRVTPLERFTLEDKLGEVQRKLQQAEVGYTAIQAFLVRHGVPSLLEASELVAARKAALGQAKDVQRSVQRHIAAGEPTGAPEGQLDRLRQELLVTKRDAAQIEASGAALKQEEARLEELLASISVDRQRAQRLQSSSVVLSTVDFGICPRCLNEIGSEMRARESHGRCCLCNRPISTTSDTPPRGQPKTADIDQQVQEAQAILDDTRQERQRSERHLQVLHAHANEIGQEIETQSRVYVTPAVDRLLATSQDVASAEAELAGAQGLLRQAEALEAISRELDALRQEQAQLQDQLKEAAKPHRAVTDELRQIYGAVLRAIDFPGFRDCSVNPYTLMPNINGQLYIHTGTALKGLATVAYHLALFELAQRRETFLPRILIIDSPAVGDLNDINHDRLLRYIANLATTPSASPGRDPDPDAEPGWQIILTTRRLVPELRQFVVETISSPDRMLLRERSMDSDKGR
jgi:hypothetical protein